MIGLQGNYSKDYGGSAENSSKRFDKPITVIVPILDDIKPKNLYQYAGLESYGYRFIIFATDSLGESQKVSQQASNIQLSVCSTRWVRIWFTVSVIRTLLTSSVDLAEMYPYSWLQLILSVIVKIAGVPLIIVARGEEYAYVKTQMPFMRRCAFRLTYALANLVIYKEIYMKQMLTQIGADRIAMLPNAVPLSKKTNSHSSGKCHFLFMNSMKSFRHPEVALEAFLQLCEEHSLSNSSNVRFLIVGFLGTPNYKSKENQLHEMLVNKDVPVELHQWSHEVDRWFEKADVFLLPADVVFLNYSLLEAMERTIPPIIQAAEGAEEIITHGKDGFIVPLDVDAWRIHMRKFAFDPELRRKMGFAAREKVRMKFSLQAYLKKYDKIYKSILFKK